MPFNNEKAGHTGVILNKWGPLRLRPIWAKTEELSPLHSSTIQLS